MSGFSTVCPNCNAPLSARPCSACGWPETTRPPPPTFWGRWLRPARPTWGQEARALAEGKPSCRGCCGCWLISGALGAAAGAAWDPSWRGLAIGLGAGLVLATALLYFHSEAP